MNKSSTTVIIICALYMCTCFSKSYAQGDNTYDSKINLGCLDEAIVTGSVPSGEARGIPDDILWNPVTNDYKTESSWHEYGLGWQQVVGDVTKDNPVYWQVEWPTAKNINYITCAGTYENQPQTTTAWAVQIKVGDKWQDLAKTDKGWEADTLRGVGYGSETQTNWLWNGLLEWRGLEPVVTTGVRFTAYANPDSLADDRNSFADSLWSFVWTGRQVDEDDPKSVLIQYIDFSTLEASNQKNDTINLALLEEAVVSASFTESDFDDQRGQPTDILYDPIKGNYYKESSPWGEFGYPWQFDAGLLTYDNCFYWQVEWPVVKNINYFSWGGGYPNQPQPGTPWAVEYWDGDWISLETGVGGSYEEGEKNYPYTPGVDADAHSIWMAENPVKTRKLRLAVWSDGATPLQSFHLRSRGGECVNFDDSENPFKAILVQYRDVVIDNPEPELPQSKKPDFSQTRGFYTEPFYLTLSPDSPGESIRYTTDCSKPDKNNGILYIEPIHITEMTTIRAVAYEDSTCCSDVRTHSFVFPENVLMQDDSDVPDEQHNKDHVFWTEEFDIDDVNCTEDEMIDALKDLPTIFISAPWDSIFGVAGIHRGQNLEEFSGDPHDPDWIELVECSAEMIYPENDKYGKYKDWQENCGIKIQGGASRWQNGAMDHKQSFTLEFKDKYGAGMLKNSILATAPFNRESVPTKFDKIILRTGFNRDFGSDWDRENYAYTRDQFARDLQMMMSGWGNHGTYAHLYINGKYWGITNPCERMDDNALATYFGGENEDYFYGKGKGGIRFGNADRYNYLVNTDWTNRQFSEIEEYLVVNPYIDNVILHSYGNIGDGAQYYYGGRTNPPGPIYYTSWDMEDSFDGGARRSGAPVALENLGSIYSGDKFLAYYQMKNNIDFKMRFADRIYKYCFNNGVLTNDRVTAVWDSSCSIISKAMLCEIARWGDERGSVLDHDHWKSECKDVRDDLIGRADKYITEVKKVGMYPVAEPPDFYNESEKIITSTYEYPENFYITITFPNPQSGNIYYTIDGTDPRLWNLTGNVSPEATKVAGIDTTILVSQSMIIKARLKDGNVWSPIHELKINPQENSTIVINEINYDSDSDFDTEDWIEIYNNSDDDISLDGWKLKDSKDDNIFNFSSGTVIKADAFLVICCDKSDFSSLFEDVTNCIGDIEFKFSNDGDAVRIFDNDNILIDAVVYDDEEPWPASAGGEGHTLELVNPDLDNTKPENWKASKGNGSPGNTNSVFTETAIDEGDDMYSQISQYSLSQNYPNPFNPSTNIKYYIACAGPVTLKIYNLVGQEIKTIVNDFQQPGEYSVQWTVEDVPSGIYFYQLNAMNFCATKKLVVIK